jgi:hypothetical protein
MSDRNQSGDRDRDAFTGKDRGMQGIDKAPGEEPAQSAEQFIDQTQRGRNKNDGDPTKESDKPLNHQDIER